MIEYFHHFRPVKYKEYLCGYNSQLLQVLPSWMYIHKLKQSISCVFSYLCSQLPLVFTDWNYTVKSTQVANSSHWRISSFYTNVTHGDDTINLHEASREHKAFIKLLNSSLNDSTSLWAVTKWIAVWQIGPTRRLLKCIAWFVTRNSCKNLQPKL